MSEKIAQEISLEEATKNDPFFAALGGEIPKEVNDDDYVWLILDPRSNIAKGIFSIKNEDKAKIAMNNGDRLIKYPLNTMFKEVI